MWGKELDTDKLQNTGHKIKNSRDARYNMERWKCYKPECHYGTIKDWIFDNLWNKHKEKITYKTLGQYRYV